MRPEKGQFLTLYWPSRLKLRGSGIAPKEVAKNLGVSAPTLYRWVPTSARAERTTFLFSEATPELESNTISTTALAPYLPP